MTIQTKTATNLYLISPMDEPIKNPVDIIAEQTLSSMHGVWKQLENTGGTFESVNIIILPLEKSVTIDITEHINGRKKQTLLTSKLDVKEVDFYSHMRDNIPKNARINQINPYTNLTPALVEELLKRNNDEIPSGILSKSILPE